MAIFVLAFCYTCRQMIFCNPIWVPSVPAHLTTTKTREPVCSTCVARANPARIAKGWPPIVIHPQAYEPEPEIGDTD